MDYLQKKPLSLLLRSFLAALKEKCTTRRIKILAALFVCPVATFYLFDLFTHNPFTSMNFKTQVLNIAFYQLMGIFLIGIFKWLHVALMVQSGLFMVIGLANYYVLSFRSAPIMPWDIFSIGTAASVADNFSYTLEAEAISVLGGFAVLLFVESRCRIKVATGRNKLRAAMVVLSALCLYLYTGMIQNDAFVLKFGLYDKLFTPTVMNRRDGNIVAFLMEMEYMNVDKPEGYSASRAEKLLTGDGQEAVPAVSMKEDRPNIIVIMDEAFSDLSVLGEFETTEEYMPFLRSLQQGRENTITGYLNVSVLGGNTANTEFEFLTGHTLAFLPQGSVAYQQYINKEVPSLASYCRDLGYRTVAMHPYYPDGWDRDRVYPLLGFQEFYSLNDFYGEEKVRKYISDQACFDRITKLYEEKGEEPLFLFNVTMQNHSGYTESFSNFNTDVEIKGTDADALDQYLSLMKLTDNALSNLISYFENADEETMIVFFGDHQPTASVSNPILKLNGVPGGILPEEEEGQRYMVPYVIWANYDIEEKTGEETSANFLAAEVLSQSGLKLPAYQSYLAKLKGDYPVVSAVRIKDKTGVSHTREDVEEQLREYEELQYYLIFDYEQASSE